MDENYTLMVAKEKGIWPNDNNKCYGFEYLMNKYLHSPDDWADFCESVKEIYILLQESSNEYSLEDYLPTSSSISDLLDEQNITTIHLFFEGKDDSLLDDVINKYTASVSQQLSYKTIEALDSIGLPYRDDYSGEIKLSDEYRSCDPDQIIMFGGEIYE